jgi:hypothetical protein
MNRNRNHIIGSFVFRNEGDGCLTSKYHNDGSLEAPFTEACKLIDSADASNNFIGRYRTVWLEDFNNHEAIELLIERSTTNPSLFKLTWYRPGNLVDPTFEGSGMRYGDLLVGSYWD